MRRICLLIMAVSAFAVGATVFAPVAGAVQPIKSQITFSDTSPLTGVCPFDVTVESSVNLTLLQFFDQSGALTRWNGHVVEQNTFTANGKSLTSLPHTFEFEALFDSSGAITHFFENGVLARVVLPDGSVFLAAGRVDFVPHGSPPFLFTPDAGTSGNVAGFCAALSP
jgi:hypothetical protein